MDVDNWLGLFMFIPPWTWLLHYFAGESSNSCLEVVLGFSEKKMIKIRLTLERPEGGQMDPPPIGFSDLKFEAFKQSKWNFQ